MPKGPLGFPRLTSLGPLTKKTRDERIEEHLTAYADNVTSTEQYASTRFTFRMRLQESTYNLPVTQNIPSNMAARGDSAEGVVRTPMIGRRAGTNPEEASERIKSLTDPDIDVDVIDSGEGRLRPHVIVEGVTVEEFIVVVAQLSENYEEEFQ